MRKTLLLPDIQYPNHNQILLTKVEEYMKKVEWDYLIYLGDALDMDAISHHAMQHGDHRSLENKRLKKDYDEFSKILRRHRKIVGPKCKTLFFMGNHEEWPDRLVDKIPGLEGLIEPQYCLPFNELNIELVDPRHPVVIDGITYIHGDLNNGPYSPKHHAMKVAELYNRVVVYGHHHTLQVFTKPSPFGFDEKHTAYCLPALADIQPSWSKKKPNSWVNGFGVAVSDEDHFSVIPIIAQGNEFFAPTKFHDSV